jgi:hypothetical protein
VVRALETICIVVTGLSACYEPPQPDCGFYCGAGSTCPEDYTCTADNRCRRNGAPASATCEPDAGIVGSDVIRFDGFVDADNTPPMVNFTSPSDGSSNVSVNAAVVVSFTEPVFNVSSLTFTAFTNGNLAPGQLAALGSPPDYSTYQLTPNAPLPAGMAVTVTLTNQIYDNAGNALVTPGSGQYLFAFTTAP